LTSSRSLCSTPAAGRACSSRDRGGSVDPSEGGKFAIAFMGRMTRACACSRTARERRSGRRHVGRGQPTRDRKRPFRPPSARQCSTTDGPSSRVPAPGRRRPAAIRKQQVPARGAHTAWVGALAHAAGARPKAIPRSRSRPRRQARVTPQGGLEDDAAAQDQEHASTDPPAGAAATQGS